MENNCGQMDLYIKDNLKKEREMEKESIHYFREHFIKVSGNKENYMDSGLIIGRMEENIKGIGKII